MEKDMILESPKHKFIDFLTCFILFHPIFLALVIILLKLKVDLDIICFIIYSLIYSILSLFLLINFIFRNYTRMIIKKDDKVLFYRYKKYRLDLMFHIDNIDSIVVRKSILGIKLRIFINVNSSIWSINNIYNKEKIYIDMLVNDEMLVKLKSRLLPFKIKWEDKINV